MAHRLTTLIAVAAVALAACGGSSDPSDADAGGDTTIDQAVDDTTPDDPTPSTDNEAPTTADSVPAPTEPDEAPVCATQQDGGGFETTPCDEPHDAEFAGIVAAPDGTAPEPPDVDPDDSNPDQYPDMALAAACVDSVAGLVGVDPAAGGIAVGYVSSAAPGESYTGDIECWVLTSAEDVLSASIADVGFADALGDHDVLSNLEDGTCFRFADPDGDSFEVVVVVDCADAPSDPTIEQAVARVMLDDAEYPGRDALLDASYDACDAAIAASGVEMISADYGIVYPEEKGWTALGQRGVSCVAYTIDPADVEPVCAVLMDDFVETPCDEPHDSELVGVFDPPEGSLPDNADDAINMLTAHCAPYVAEFTGLDLTMFGIGVAFNVNVALGDPFDGPFECWAHSSSSEGLTASIREVGFEAASVYDVITDLEPGTCFLYGTDSFTLAYEVPCDTPEALMEIGDFVLDDGPFPGDDPIREIRSVRCGEILAASGLAADPATVSGTFPSSSDWVGLDRRVVTCDAVPL